MKCKICKAEAVVALRSHNAAFCPDCYKTFFSRQVARGIEGQKLFTRDERVLVALSGGKDSLALMLELSRQGYNVTGLHIDLAIPVSSAAARGVVERFCAKHGLTLMVKEMAAEGLPIPVVKERLNRLEWVSVGLAVAAGEIDEEGATRFLRDVSVPYPG